MPSLHVKDSSVGKENRTKGAGDPKTSLPKRVGEVVCIRKKVLEVDFLREFDQTPKRKKIVMRGAGLKIIRRHSKSLRAIPRMT